MMVNDSFLVFSLLGSLFAVEASVVRAILWLPEVTPIEETPRYILGVINLRGKIIPIMDLRIRFHRAPVRYFTTNRVIVIAMNEMLLGIIVDDVHDVTDISKDKIEPSPFHGRKGEIQPHFVTRAAKVGKDIIMILDYSNLLDSLELTGNEIERATPLSTEEFRYFCPEASQEERVIFHERAMRFMRAEDDEGIRGATPMAVVGLSGEYFGIDLGVVREFSNIRKVAPIPCCPPHIVGNMNLRGNIITLVDIRGFLDLTPGAPSTMNKVIVAGTGELFVGVVVDDLLDVLYLNQANIAPLPSAVHTANEKHFKGTAPYGDKTMTIIDLHKILTSNALVVNEEP